eukprot:190102-Ditylum_brightwellii.AAC.1
MAHAIEVVIAEDVNPVFSALTQMWDTVDGIVLGVERIVLPVVVWSKDDRAFCRSPALISSSSYSSSTIVSFAMASCRNPGGVVISRWWADAQSARKLKSCIASS